MSHIDLSIETVVNKTDLTLEVYENNIDLGVESEKSYIDLILDVEQSSVDLGLYLEEKTLDLNLEINKNSLDLEVSTTVVEIDLEVSPAIIISGNLPNGGLARQVLKKNSSSDGDYSWSYSYEDFLINVEYTGVDSVVSDGNVLSAKIDSQDIYRFISNQININGYPEEDSFYSDFNGTDLTNLIITRG